MAVKKILFVTLSMKGGGAEKIMSRLIHYLSGEAHICLVLFYKGGKHFEEVLSLTGVVVHSLGGEKGNTFTKALRLKKIIVSVKPDRILSFLYYPNIVTYLSLLGKDIPFFLSERSNHRFYLGSSFKHKIWKILLSKAYRKASGIITVSERAKDYITEDFRTTPSKIEVIHNGLDFKMLDRLKKEPVDGFCFEKGLKYILAVGSLVKAKNYPLLIESFRIAAGKRKDLRLIILGSGVMENDLKRMVEDYDLVSLVSFPGYVDNPYSFMAAAACYVLSSDWEGFPNSLLEAMYVNGHVVSTDCPTGPSEIISHGVDGLLCEPGNPSQLAEAIEKMCYDEEFRQMVWNNSRQKIINFGEEKMIARYRELLLK